MKDQAPKSEYTQGDMPQPKWMMDNPGTDRKVERWIGIEAFSSREKSDIGKYYFWRNEVGLDLVTPRGRFEIARNIARLMLTTGADVVLGPAVDLANSDGETGKITTLEEEGVFGFYVEAEKRRGFSLSANLPSIRSLYRISSREFKRAITFAELALPFSETKKGAN